MRRPWIKIEICTPDKPEICSLATQLKMDDDAVVGKLVRLWSWAELNRINPNDLGVTKEFIDKLVGRKGFAQALEKTGWLIETDEKLSFRNFKRHNSPVAQNKALTAKRVARHRLRKAAEEEKVTDKTLAGKILESPPVEKRAAPVKPAKKVNKAVSSLATSEKLNVSIDPEVEEKINVDAEPVVEPTVEPVVEPTVEPVIEPSAETLNEPVAAEPVAEPVVQSLTQPAETPNVVEEPELPPPAAPEEAVVTAPVEEPATRKRRGKAAANTDDQPLLF